MRQIRRGVFETNSSSTHSLTICTEDQFNDWKAGKIFYDSYNEEFCEKFKLTDHEKMMAEKDYEEHYGSLVFHKKWNELTEEEKEVWYQRYYISEIKDIEDEVVTYKEYFYNGHLETYTQSYVTPKGEKLIAFGKYGYD